MCNSSDNPYNFYTKFLSASPLKVSKYLKTCWNIKQFCDLSLSKWLFPIKKVKSNVWSFFTLYFHRLNQVHFYLFSFARFFDSSAIFVWKFICVNLLKSWVIINLLLLGIVLSASSISFQNLFYSRFCLIESIEWTFFTKLSYQVVFNASFFQHFYLI